MTVLRVGETVGPYEILARLKAGGMATLFVGQKRGAAGFSRHVAIKVVHEHLASDQEFVRMFVDEALLQARIHHPNVVHVEELGETPSLDGSPVHYLVMEYVYGCSLSQLLDSLARRNRRLSPELAVHIAIQTLAGLHAAHELKDASGANLGVVHRDVSPQNVLLAYEGHVKLIDFGVAKARNRSQQTTGASIKGKIRYMPPEQAMGLSAIDRRADVYALGIILWEMLALRKLFGAKDDLQLLESVRNPKIVPPSRLSKDVPPEIDRVVMKALSPRPEDRWASAQEFRRALAEVMPKAMLLDASHVADLLVAVMADQMQKDREALPSQLSAVVANDARRESVQADEAIHTMTISAMGTPYLQDLGIEASIDASPPVQADKPEIPSFAPPPPASAPVAPMTQQGSGESWAGDPAIGTPARQTAAPSRVPMVLGVAAALLIAVAAGAWYMMRLRDEPIATSLSPHVATELGAPTPPVVVPATSVGSVPPPTTALPTTPVVEPPPPTTAISTPRPPPSTATHTQGDEPDHAPRVRRRPPPTEAPTEAPTGGSVPLADEW